MMASAVYGLGTAVSALLLAPKADRIGAHRSLAYALVVLLLGLLLSTAASGVMMLCIAQGVAGLAAGMALPATYSLTAQIAEKGKERQTLGWVLSGWTLSLVAGVTLSAVVTDLLHWRIVFALLSAVTAIVAIGVWRHGHWGQAPAANHSSSPLTALQVPGIHRGLGVCAAFMFAFYGLYAFLGTHVQEALGLSASMAGVAALAYGVGFGLATIFDSLIDRHGADRVALWVFLLLIATYFALSASSAHFVGLVSLCFIWGAVNHVGLNLVVGRLAELSDSQRGAVMGLNSAVTYLAMFLGTASFRPLFENYGFAACALVSGLCIAPAIVDGLKLRRPLAAP